MREFPDLVLTGSGSNQPLLPAFHSCTEAISIEYSLIRTLNSPKQNSRLCNHWHFMTLSASRKIQDWQHNMLGCEQSTFLRCAFQTNLWQINSILPKINVENLWWFKIFFKLFMNNFELKWTRLCAFIPSYCFNLPLVYLLTLTITNSSNSIYIF